MIGDESDLKLSDNAITLLRRRYLLKNEKGEVIETPVEMFRRVAKAVAAADALYGDNPASSEEEFYRLMTSLYFLPNSPTLMNAGTEIGQLSACFVLPVFDSLTSIFDTLKHMALIQQSGGGTGFSFSRLRPRGDIVRSTKGVASGPVSFMRIFDVATEVIKQGGRRRGANIGVLSVSHPDIIEFIRAKEHEGVLRNFNISVGVTDAFMDALYHGESYPLVNPRTGEVTVELDAEEIFDLIVRMAHKNGEPGMLFIDEINRKNPTPGVGVIEATNPCITSDTWIMTAEGARQVRELVGKRFAVVVNGKKWETTRRGFFRTGIKQVLRLVTLEGFELRLTPDHPVKRVGRGGHRVEGEWIRAQDLRPGDKLIVNDHTSLGGWDGRFTEKEGYIAGLLLGDGRKYMMPSSSENSRECVSMKLISEELGLDLKNKIITEEMERSSSEFYRGLIRGIFDVSGSVQEDHLKGVVIKLSHENLELLKAMQRMLLRMGIFSRISGFGLKDRPLKPNELVISGGSVLHFYNKIGFGDKEKMNRLYQAIRCYRGRIPPERFVATVKELIPDGVEDVYDLQVPGINSFDANGFHLHNCGEQPLLPYESCNLGSINLARMVTDDGEIAWDLLAETVRTSVHFLDNVIDVNRYPLPQIEEITRANRKIGLGVMGFSELLLRLHVPYGSEEGIEVAERVMSFIANEARKRSQEIAEARGPFKNFEGSIWDERGYSAIRNATLTTIAPTGSISIIAGTTSGIEPLFGLAFVRNVMDGRRLIEVNHVFEEVSRSHGFYSSDLMKRIAKSGTIRDIMEIPSDIRDIFQTAMDIAPEWHVRMQAAFQRYVDNGVSKTVNLPHDATLEDVREVFLLAHRLGCKGITVYRYRSRHEQVLTLDAHIELDTEYASGCPVRRCLH
ncbi:MAG: ribonucleotide reductase [Candidatus Syntrophoarchaeum sp. WYZ-LMO15]|nr:MAG: ribonucleotide reductase [Candidatus Syntrophoarchaeum sp. WYZ-LMO15]